MPNLDKETLFSENQTLIFAAGTVVSTNTVDLGAAATDVLGNALPKDAGRSDVEILCQITTTYLAAAGASTLTVQVITSAAANLGSPTVVATTGAISKATLVAGYKFRIWVPFGLTQRYLGVQYVIATNDGTAGAITSGIVGAVPTSYVG